MKQQLTNYIRAGYSGLYIVSFEEARVEAEIRAVATDRDFRFLIWSVSGGTIDATDANNPEKVNPTPPFEDGCDPMAMLATFAVLPEKSILVLRDFHMFLADPNPVLFRKLKDALAIGKASNRVLVIVGCQLKLPPELEKEITVIDFKLPDRDQLRTVLQAIAKSAGLELNGNTDPILDAASGLTTIEAENAFSLAVVEARDITPEIVAREKAATVRKNGLLEIFQSTVSLADIGGLETLKDWVSKRRLAFSRKAQDYGLPSPKGVLVVGIPGTGKSLSAKAAANILGVPLLKLDCGRIFGSLVGESERNVRAVIQTAEAIAPCVLWTDEIEKGLGGSKSSGVSDGGTSGRVFGTFLQWLQDKTAPVFVFATANDISQLPPEFLRKGRFDELWFVDLPNEAERTDIWKIHILKKGRKLKTFDVPALARASEGFTGAEIEAIVNEALFAAFDDDKPLNDDYLLAAIKTTVPLSRTMANEIDALRTWAQSRARLASPVKIQTVSGRKLA